MDEREEQPIASAFRDCKFTLSITWELVFEDDIYWGTIAFESAAKTQFRTRRNNLRFEQLLLQCLPGTPRALLLVIANYLHLHY